MQSQADEEDVVLAKRMHYYCFAIFHFSFDYFLGLLQDVRLVVFDCMVSCSSDVKYCKIYFPRLFLDRNCLLMLCRSFPAVSDKYVCP